MSEEVNNIKSSIVFSTSAMIPKANMKVVIPNKIILIRDDVKPGLLLKSHLLSAFIVLPFEDTTYRRT